MVLRPAQLYAEKLNECFLRIWYDPKFMFYSGWAGHELPNLSDNNYNDHSFVVVDSDENVIGYISYSVNWSAMSASDFGIINFGTPSIEFARYVNQVIEDLFERHNMNRISWCCFVENPAINGYRAFIKKHGGRECAYRRQVSRLMDGKLHDSVEFEILREEWRL